MHEKGGQKACKKGVKNSAKSDPKRWSWCTGLRTGLISALNRQNREFACFHDGVPLKTAQKQLKNSSKNSKKTAFFDPLFMHYMHENMGKTGIVLQKACKKGCSKVVQKSGSF
jgi:hypothetical protein